MDNKNDEGKLRYAILPIAGIIAMLVIATVLHKVFPESSHHAPPTVVIKEGAPPGEGVPPGVPGVSDNSSTSSDPVLNWRVTLTKEQKRALRESDYSVYVPERDSIGPAGP